MTLLTETPQTVQEDYLQSIRSSYKHYLTSPRSTNKTKDLHGSIAKHIAARLTALNLKDYVVRSQGYGEGKEMKVSGLYNDKMCDITIYNTRTKTVTDVIAVKFICSNYSQNANNYFENMTGETGNLRAKGVNVHQLVILPVYVPYFNKTGECTKIENINDNKLGKYIALEKQIIAAPEQYMNPNSVLLTMVNFHNKDLLVKAVISGGTIDRISEEYDTSEELTFADLNEKDTKESMNLTAEKKKFLEEQNSYEEFLDNIVNKLS